MAKMRARKISGSGSTTRSAPPLLGNIPGVWVGNAEAPLRLGQKHSAAIRGDPSIMEGGAGMRRRQFSALVVAGEAIE
jgi:hypothetical protein